MKETIKLQVNGQVIATVEEQVFDSLMEAFTKNTMGDGFDYNKYIASKLGIEQELPTYALHQWAYAWDLRKGKIKPTTNTYTDKSITASAVKDRSATAPPAVEFAPKQPEQPEMIVSPEEAKELTKLALMVSFFLQGRPYDWGCYVLKTAGYSDSEIQKITEGL